MSPLISYKVIKSNDNYVSLFYIFRSVLNCLRSSSLIGSD
jgi:hypothetical protein